jgi:hypothetical protein
MATKQVMTMPADVLFERWQAQIERIKDETTYLFTTRFRWIEIEKMFISNPELNRIGGEIHRYFLGLWARDAIMGVRRELDDQEGAINLRNLLHEIEARPEVLCRRRVVSRVKEEWLRPIISKQFDADGATCPLSGSREPDDDHISPTRTRADRRSLEANTKDVFDYAQRMVAHRTPIDGLELTARQINDAIDVIEPILQRYYRLLVGPSLVGATAAIQYDWMEPFTIPWALEA